MDSNDDPFTQAGRAILDALLGYAGFADLVRVGNALGSDRRSGLGVAKPSGMPSDFAKRGTAAPGGELRVVEAGYELHPYGSNSRASEAVQSYDVQLATATLDSAPLNRLKWNAQRALLHADAGGLCLGLPFVRNWTISPATQQPTRTTPTGEQPGWSSTFTVNVEMVWDRKSL